MSDFNLVGRYPDGTSVSAYPVSNWDGGVPNKRLPPVGPASDTQVMVDGELTFTGLDPFRYVAYAEVEGTHRYIDFQPGQDENPTNLVTPAQHRALAGTTGMPDSDNRYVTDEDARLDPTSAIQAALEPPWIPLDSHSSWEPTPFVFPPSYRKIGDIVYLAGAVTVAFETVGGIDFNLPPVGYRAQADQFGMAAVYTGNPGSGQVATLFGALFGTGGGLTTIGDGEFIAEGTIISLHGLYYTVAAPPP